jgi:uncharacterized membrane protein
MFTSTAIKASTNTRALASNTGALSSSTRALRILGEKNGFRWRSHEITRVEGLSDAVFAFAVTLLIVSLEVPKSFDELLNNLRGFFAFAACFAQLMLVWYHQYLYYRRYNLQDYRSTVLSMALLFVVLFYTYPLKFVFSSFLTPLAGGEQTVFKSIDEVRNLYLIYAGGVAAVFTVFTLMYAHAYAFRDTLGLSELERHDTLHTLREMIGYISVAIFSAVLALTLPDELIGFAGMAYAMTGVVLAVHGTWSGKTRGKIEQRSAAEIGEKSVAAGIPAIHAVASEVA